MEFIGGMSKSHQMALRKKYPEVCEENAVPSLNTKRSAEGSPDLNNKKRPILCDITNSKNVKNAKVSSNNAKSSIKALKASVGSLIEEALPKKSTDEPAVFADEKDTRFMWEISVPPVPPEIEDFDQANKGDINAESKYAPYIFAYYKEREKKFPMEKYMSRQPEITKGMRACLMDWLVEVQESFELNHETLYLAVKLVDMYLMKHKIPKITLQLVGATAMLIAAKYDERIPPVVDDFLYICDDSYSRAELLSMECSILRTVDFDLGIPISYRFLRRYARCAKASMDTLTLARYVLETCLMDYELIDYSDSKIAAAAFLLALRMKQLGDWTPTLEYYSGYKEEELEDYVRTLNKNISAPPNRNLMTIRNKYSHPIFFSVAKIHPLKYPESSH